MGDFWCDKAGYCEGKQAARCVEVSGIVFCLRFEPRINAAVVIEVSPDSGKHDRVLGNAIARTKPSEGFSVVFAYLAAQNSVVSVVPLALGSALSISHRHVACLPFVEIYGVPPPELHGLCHADYCARQARPVMARRGRTPVCGRVPS